MFWVDDGRGSAVCRIIWHVLLGNYDEKLNYVCVYVVVVDGACFEWSLPSSCCVGLF